MTTLYHDLNKLGYGQVRLRVLLDVRGGNAVHFHLGSTEVHVIVSDHTLIFESMELQTIRIFRLIYQIPLSSPPLLLSPLPPELISSTRFAVRVLLCF